MKTIKHFTVVAVFLYVTLLVHGQTPYYFPKAGSFDPAIPTPEQFFGYPIGSHYTRHDQIVAYFTELARVSNKVHIQVIGKTYEFRSQVIVTITSPDNYSKLEQIRQEHLNQVDPSKPVLQAKAPVVVLLGYSVHGNETSSGEVSLLQAYYLAANQSEETQRWLKEAVIFLDPSLNPDGRDRAANWYNAYKSVPPVADGLDKEHQEQWPGGRSNHYLNNLNRDWLNLSQIESVNRVAFFHQWYPNVQIDFHEQGANATYYFEPSPKRHQNPVVPQFLYDFNAVLAKYHAKALDDIGSLYFTKESYDNLSPIYGSTYPKFFGSVAATFEEASSGGLVKETTNGLLTFPFTIRNHLVTSIATIRGAVAEKEGLFKVQKDFFKYSLDLAKQSPTKAFVFGDSRDENLTQKFLDLLLKHHVKVYELADNLTQEGKKFEKGKSYIVPTEQSNYIILHSIFEEISLKDSIFYDNTGWSIIHAYGLQYSKLAGTFSKGDAVTKISLPRGEINGGVSSYAYLVSWTDYNASKALYYLLDKDILVKTAFKPFSVPTAKVNKPFGYGTLVIPVVGQRVPADSLFRIVKTIADSAHISVLSVPSGFNAEGIDLGSSNIKAVRKPEVAIAFGQGINSEEAGQVWFLLNQHLNLPLVKIDVSNFQRASLRKYNTLVLPGGNYSNWDKQVIDKIKSWVSEGGTLITFQNATAWAVEQGLVKEKLVETDIQGGRRNDAAKATETATSGAVKLQNANGTATANTDTENGTRKNKDGVSKTERLDFVKEQDTEGAKRVNGAIFETDIDITHPIGFGLNSRKLFINKNGNTLLVPGNNKYSTVAQYTAHPFINGYASKESIAKISNSAAILSSSEGLGSVVLFADDPTYRSYWLGTNRLFLNAIFFGNLTSKNYGGAEEEL